jgi:hypothetical protein
MELFDRVGVEIDISRVDFDISVKYSLCGIFKELSGLITCQDLQAEHVDMRVINCINGCYAIIDVGSAHSLIP